MRDKHGVMIGDQRRQRRAAGCAHARPALDPHPERDQSRDVGVDGRSRQVVRIAGGKARQRPVLRLEHRRRAPFHREVEGGREAGQSGADDRDALGLARRLRRAADRRVGLADHHAFERRNTDRSARLGPAAGGFARVIADPAEHSRQRDGTGVDRAGGGEVAGLDLFDHRAGVDVQRAGRRAGGRLLLDAAGFPLVDALAVHVRDSGKKSPQRRSARPAGSLSGRGGRRPRPLTELSASSKELAEGPFHSAARGKCILSSSPFLIASGSAGTLKMRTPQAL